MIARVVTLLGCLASLATAQGSPAGSSAAPSHKVTLCTKDGASSFAATASPPRGPRRRSLLRRRRQARRPARHDAHARPDRDALAPAAASVQRDDVGRSGAARAARAARRARDQPRARDAARRLHHRARPRHRRRGLRRRRTQARHRAGHHSRAAHDRRHARHRRDGQLRPALHRRRRPSAGRRGGRRHRISRAWCATRSATAPTGSRCTPTTGGGRTARRVPRSRSTS